MSITLFCYSVYLTIYPADSSFIKIYKPHQKIIILSTLKIAQSFACFTVIRNKKSEYLGCRCVWVRSPHKIITGKDVEQKEAFSQIDF